MNNTGKINEARGSCVGERRYKRRGAAEMAAPAWLVAICRVIVWLSLERTAELIRPVLAISAVMLLAVVAGAIGTGAIPLFHGVVICACLSAMALLAVRE